MNAFEKAIYILHYTINIIYKNKITVNIFGCLQLTTNSYIFLIVLFIKKGYLIFIFFSSLCFAIHDNLNIKSTLLVFDFTNLYCFFSFLNILSLYSFS